MRMDQFVGLNDRAKALIAGCGKPHFTGRYEAMPVMVSEGGMHQEQTVQMPVLEPCVRQEATGQTFSGMFEGEPGYPLHKYTTRDGKVYYEVLQDSPWSSGPVFFLALSVFSPEEQQRLLAGVQQDWKLQQAVLRGLCHPDTLWTAEEIAENT